jgi:hypothetical protein
VKAMTKTLELRAALAKCRNHRLQVVRFKVAENVCEGVTTDDVALWQHSPRGPPER